jgi:dolichol-phosphate mannosyltransferase
MECLSQDGTDELINGLSKQYPVRIIVRKDKRGLASAVVDGLKYASSAIVGVMDADLQHPPVILVPLLVQVQNGVDLAIASRYAPGGGCEGWSFSRRIISRGAIVLAHLLLPPTRRTHDPMSGYFMFFIVPIHPIIKTTVNSYKILLVLMLRV